MEVWKRIKKEDGTPYGNNIVSGYFVSNMGRIKSVNFFGESRVLRPISKGKQRYLRVHLADHGKTKTVSVHRLVMCAFAGRCPDGMEVDHINHDRSDNRLNNLRYVTHRENMKNLIPSDLHGNCIKYGKRVRCIETGAEFLSIKATARRFGLEPKGVRRSCNTGGTCGSLHFEFMEN